MRCHLFRSLSLSLAIVLGVSLVGCATNGAPATSAGMPRTTEASTWAFFIDTGDSGDDAWTAGCHFKCSDAGCDGATEFWGGDWCSGSDLQEWTNSEPHAAASDITRHDCDEECKAKGLAGGQCVRVEKACGDRWPSSRCKCDE